MQLSEWLKLAKLSQKGFAEKLRVSPATVCRLLGGSLEPSITLMDNIERETSGAVRYEDWREKVAAKQKEEADGAAQ